MILATQQRAIDADPDLKLCAPAIDEGGVKVRRILGKAIACA